MGVLEVQFRKEAFLKYFMAELNRLRLPFARPSIALIPVELHGALLERIECLGASIAPTTGQGRLTVQADMVIHYYTSFAEVRAAGRLQPAPTRQLRQTVAFQLSIEFVNVPGQPRRPMLQFSSEFAFLPISPLPLSLPVGINAQVGAIEASEDVVAVRLGTKISDVVNGPVVDQVGQNDWTQRVPGEVLSDLLVANLATALGGTLPDGLKVNKAASGAWVTQAIPFTTWQPPLALATAELVAEDVCVFNIDIFVSLTLVANFQLIGHSLVQTLTLSWDADSTLCDITSGLFFTPITAIVVHVIAEDKASEGILGSSQGPKGFVKIGQDDNWIQYQRTTFIDFGVPSLVLTHSEVTNDGLVFAGDLQTQAGRRGLEGEVSPPKSVLKTDCSTRSVSVYFQPAKVYLRDIGVGGPPRLFPEWTTFDPPNAWVVTAEIGNSWMDLVLGFADPPTGRLPVGTRTSVFLHTDCGLRWVDLGVVPADRSSPTVQEVAGMFSECMSISDPLGEGMEEVLNLDWLTDPPDVLRGFPPVRQWTLGFRDLPESVRFELVARGPAGGERQLSTIERRRDVAVQVYTGADETLDVRFNQRVFAPSPIVSQSWVTPFTTVAVDTEPVALAAAGSTLGFVGHDGVARFLGAGLDGEMRAPAVNAPPAEMTINRVVQTLSRGTQDNHTELTARLDKHTVAFVYNGELLLGTIGPSMRL